MSWPNDPEWEAFAAKTIAQGVPALEALVGQPWPVKGQLKVIEAVTPYLRGYSGWFSPSTNTIEIGERLDAESMLHELAHAGSTATCSSTDGSTKPSPRSMRARHW